MSDLSEALNRLRKSVKEEAAAMTAEEKRVQEQIAADPAINIKMPEPGTYSQDDMSENDDIYKIIREYMFDRFGLQAVRNKSREEVVDKFLNNRRGVAAGNTVRGLNEFDF